MEEADRQFYSTQGSPVEPSSSGLLGPDFGPLPQSPAPFASPAYVPQTPSPIPEVQQILAEQEEEEINAALAGHPRSHSTSSTPNSEVSALGERDAHFQEAYQQQADNYMAVNPRPPSSSLSSQASSHHSSGLSFHNASPFPAAPRRYFPSLRRAAHSGATIVTTQARAGSQIRRASQRRHSGFPTRMAARQSPPTIIDTRSTGMENPLWRAPWELTSQSGGNRSLPKRRRLEGG
jgi:hypothetical protein